MSRVMHRPDQRKRLLALERAIHAGPESPVPETVAGNQPRPGARRDRFLQDACQLYPAGSAVLCRFVAGRGLSCRGGRRTRWSRLGGRAWCTRS
jgi:hypothetical protein